MIGSFEARGTSCAGVIPIPDQSCRLVRRRSVAVLAEILLCTLVFLSAAARQPSHTHTGKWHTCKASKMLECSGKLAREDAREQTETGFSAPAKIRPRFQANRISLYQFNGLPALQLLRSPPQA